MTSPQRWLALAAAALAAAAALWWLVFRDADRRAVQKRLDTIVASVTKPAGEGNIAMLAKHQALTLCLDDAIRVRASLRQHRLPDLDQEYPADQALSLYASLRRMCRTIDIGVRGVDITFPQPDTARLACFATLKATSTYGDAIEESRPVILTFRKRDGDWRLAVAEERQVIR